MKSKYVEKMERILAMSRYAEEFQRNKDHPRIDVASLNDESNIEDMNISLEKRVRRGKWAENFLKTGISDGSIDFISIGYRGSKEEFDWMLRCMIESGKQAEIELTKNHENHECGVCDG